MKILLVSMPSIHVRRWIDNLKNTQYELFWFDVTSRGILGTSVISKDKQYVNWSKRKVPYIKGEYFLSKKAPNIFKIIHPFLEINASEYLETIIKNIKPEVIHSFEMQSCSIPLLKTMIKYPDIKWVYSCWGSDLYYYSQFKNHKKQLLKVLSRINYLITDCNRDKQLAFNLGFKGTYIGPIFGGGGFDLDKYNSKILPLKKRKIILVKGYEHEFGRAIHIIKALELILEDIKNYEVHIFASHEKVEHYIKTKKLPFKIYGRHNLKHDELMELMGQSLLYIGNSISDGLPNTLLEAIIMGAFPIQSNPGGASEDVINNGINGFLIHDPNDIGNISDLIIKALKSNDIKEKAYAMNSDFSIKNLNYEVVNSIILKAYKKIGQKKPF